MSSLSPEDKKAKEFLETYHNTISPTGCEMAGQRVWVDYVSGYMSAGKGDDFEYDAYGSVAAVIKGTAGSNFKVVLDAHADEISWRIQTISDKGILGVMRNGGSDSLVAPGSFINVQGKNGLVEGVIGAPAIHVRHDDPDKKIKDHELVVDVAADSRQEVLEMGIDIGMTLTYASGFKELNGGKYYAGRALDDRTCGYINAQVIRRLKEQQMTLPYDLYIVNAVQEETGLRGAKLMANKIKPDMAIALDVSHDTQTTGYNKAKQGDISCGKGPIISYGAPLHTKVIDLIIASAAQEKIAIQKESVGYSSGTDTDAYAYEGTGCPSALISLPQKYMHTAVEMVSSKDVKDVENLLLATLQNIQGQKAQFDYYAQDRLKWKERLKK